MIVAYIFFFVFVVYFEAYAVSEIMLRLVGRNKAGMWLTLVISVILGLLSFEVIPIIVICLVLDVIFFISNKSKSH